MEINEVISQDSAVSLTRKAKVHEFVWKPSEGYIKLITVVSFYDINGNVVERFAPYFVPLTALNSTLVNPSNGNSVEDGENQVNCTVGEYDYLCQVANTNINIFNIMKATIAKADSRQRFDK